MVAVFTNHGVHILVLYLNSFMLDGLSNWVIKLKFLIAQLEKLYEPEL